MNRIQLAVVLGLLSIGLYAASGPAQMFLGNLPGDPIRGAHIYDNWLLALDEQAPQGEHPLWSRQESNPRGGQVTWRCVECHGWDYKGADGAYGEGSIHFTGFPGLSGAIGASQEEVLAWLDGTINEDHNFLQYMNPMAINDLAAFLRTEQLELALFIDYENADVLGDQVQGAALYAEGCLGCHGPEGRAINFATAGSPTYVGDLAEVDPWHTFHTIRFGTPIGNMPNSEELNWTLNDVTNVLAYAQELPRGNPTFAIFSPPSAEASIESQGDMELIMLGASAILGVVALGLAWDAIRQRRREQ